MGNSKDMDEKFKKDVSKEIANLKEFLIQQGKEIVKIKQDVKASRDTPRSGEVTPGSSVAGGIPADVKATLDKHQHALDKQKENITKLSKLCLGTLTELEKLEKDQQNKSKNTATNENKEKEIKTADPRSEEKFKRLTEENKKLIQLVTTLDQQVTVLEAKVDRGIGGGLSRPHSRLDLQNAGSGLSKEEVVKMISQESLSNKDFIMKMIQDQFGDFMMNAKQRDGEMGELFAQFDRMNKINRTIEKQMETLNDQVREVEQRIEIQVNGQMETALNKIKKLEETPPVPSPRQKIYDNPQRSAAAATVVTNGTDSAKIETEINNLKTAVNDSEKRVEMNLRGEIWKLETAVESAKKITETSGRNYEQKIGEIEVTLKTLAGQINQLEKTATSASTNSEKAVTAAEKASQAADKASAAADKAVAKADKAAEAAEKSVNASSDASVAIKTAANAKTTADKALEVATKIQKEEAQAKSTRNESSIISADELRRDLGKIDVKNQALEDKIQQLEKNCQDNSIELKSQDDKYSGQLSILSEKVKTMSLNQREEKIKIEEKLSYLENEISKSQSDDTLSEVKEITKQIRSLEKSSTSCEESLKKLKSSHDSTSAEQGSQKAKIDNITKLVEELKGKNKETVQDIETVRDGLNKLNKKVDLRPVTDDSDKKTELTNKLYTDLVTKIDDVDSSLQKEVKKTRSEVDKLSTQVSTLESKVTDTSASMDRKITSLQDEASAVKYKSEETSAGLQEYTKQIDKMKQDLKSSVSKVEEANKEIKSIKSDFSSTKLSLDKISSIEAELKGFQIESQKSKVTDIMKDINSLRSDLEKSTKEVRSVSTEVKYLDSTIKKDAAGQKTEFNNFSKSIKSLEKDLTTLHNMVEVLNSESGKELGEEVASLKTDLKSCDREIKSWQNKLDDLERKGAATSQSETTSLSTKIQDIKTSMDKLKTDTENKCDKLKEDIEKKIRTDITDIEKKLATNKPADNSECERKLKTAKDELTKQVDKCKEDFNTRITLTDTKILKFKEDMTKLNKDCDTKFASADTKLAGVITRLGKVEDTAKSSTGKKDDSSSDIKKELDKVSNQLKDNIGKLETKLSSQETAVTAVKQSVKDVTDKVGKLDAGKKSTNSADSDHLQQTVRKLETECSTKKDLDKAIADLSIKINEVRAQNGGGAAHALDPNHPDIGPIMDSLIMTNDRPYVDCMTLTPMTGNGLVKFDRFTAMNKMPWDDANDQFVIQEPGVYSVFISGILQDALLSVKIASNMLEREVCCIGSREGILGVKTPTFVFKSGLFQIEDDDNVCETVFIEIHADNPDSFVDKNVSLTLYKIAESPGGE